MFNKKWMLEPIKYLVAAVVLSLGGTCRIPGTWNAAADDPTAAAAAAAGTQTAAGESAAAAGGRLQTNVHADARSEATPAVGAGNGAGNGAGHGLTPVNGFPVLLVSHGLAGQRNTYSCICTDMASQGFVVVALEHADGEQPCFGKKQLYLQSEALVCRLPISAGTKTGVPRAAAVIL